MKESYLPELNEMYRKVASTLLQHDSNPQQPETDQLERLKVYKMMLERIITFLQVSKSNILPIFKEKLGSYEKQIINLININRPRKAMSSLQPVQLPPAHMHSMSQPQSQVTQVQSHENQMNSQSQTANIQNSVATMQQNNMANQALLEEVKVNQRLIYTVVDISDEDVDPTKSSGGNNTIPTCDCKEKPKAVLRTATTTENLGKRFWGCRHYKKGVEGSGCGFFMWFRDDSIDERDFVIASQRRKIVKLQTALASTRRWLELLITIICLAIASSSSIHLHFILFYSSARYCFSNSQLSLCIGALTNHLSLSFLRSFEFDGYQ
ncbi:hypothetical protein RIF29_28302 [Crotalaria pallida]|uniref:GRF-type domain-containing protein n=1 Tax=Crotalaria pallida TaxID=3830 RepID=A0AAN9EVH2_CROPI